MLWTKEKERRSVKVKIKNQVGEWQLFQFVWGTSPARVSVFKNKAFSV